MTKFGDPRPVLLVLTVGGSAEPLRTALARLRPDEALFVVSEPSGDQPGSAPQVEGSLRGCDGFPAVHHLLAVPADDLDRAFALIEARLAAAKERQLRVIADYTGGTKSMSAALVTAAWVVGGVELQVTTGQRRDLVRVVDGTETPTSVADRLLGLRQRLKVAEELVIMRNYGAALAVLPRDEAAEGAPKGWRRRLALWREWLMVMDRWDRFDHRGALEALKGSSQRPRLQEALAADGLVERLEALAKADGKPSAALCEDLWWNAERRAALGAYDEAVARLYRLAEAAIQARLFIAHGIDTGAVPVGRLPPGFLKERPHLQPDARLGTCALALSDARAVLAYLEPASPVPGWWADGPPKWQSRRNHSILAHGFSPMTPEDWQEARDWFAQRAAQLWRDLPCGAEATQLPDRLPAA